MAAIPRGKMRAVKFMGTEERRVTGTCLCGAVSVTVDTRPEFINDCNCSLCRKAGAAWGYYPSSSVTTSGNTVPFVRRDDNQRYCTLVMPLQLPLFDGSPPRL
jgi:hypothetical protein